MRNLRLILTIAIGSLFLVSCAEDTDISTTASDFVGTWTCNETSGDFSPRTYTVNIMTNGSSISIHGLYSSNVSLNANVYGASLEIPTQSSGGITFAGSGSINSSKNRIDLSFSANDGSGTDDVVVYMTK